MTRERWKSIQLRMIFQAVPVVIKHAASNARSHRRFILAAAHQCAAREQALFLAALFLSSAVSRHILVRSMLFSVCQMADVSTPARCFLIVAESSEKNFPREIRRIDSEETAFYVTFSLETRHLCPWGSIMETTGAIQLFAVARFRRFLQEQSPCGERRRCTERSNARRALE